jgi:hypothetical protein
MWVAVGALAWAACGGSTAVDGETSSSATGGSTTTGGSTGTTGSGAAGGSLGGGGSGAAGGDAAGGSGGIASAGGGGAMPATEWRADAWPGGLDHIIVSQLDVAADRCLRILIDAPTMGVLGVTVPAPWGVNAILAWDDTTDCLDTSTSPPGMPVDATAAAGSVSFMTSGMSLYPCELDVTVSATFSNPPAWLAPTLQLQTTMLEVQGACP